MKCDMAPADRSKAETEKQDHRRTHQQPDGVQVRTVKIYRRIELGHPQARGRCDKPARDQYPPAGAMPVGLAAAQARVELECAEDAVDHGAHNVQDHGQRCRKKSRVVWSDLRAPAELNYAES